MQLNSPRCQVVLFDAVGTLFFPDPPVAVAYQHYAQQIGSLLTTEEISARFATAFRREFPIGRNVPTSEATERQRWQRVVAEVFVELPAAKDELFAALWNHFANGRHWRLYDDVIPTWNLLQQHGLRVGIASNFDKRLKQVVQAFPLLNNVPTFCSAEVGFAKPDRRFFAAIEQTLACRPTEILLVGDHYDCDYLGAQNAGWHSIWLQREVQSTNEQRISSLHALAERVLAKEA